ncbi:hypothetical protein Plhal304r1_c073g0161521 [Plasmopara halstedii]
MHCIKKSVVYNVFSDKARYCSRGDTVLVQFAFTTIIYWPCAACVVGGKNMSGYRSSHWSGLPHDLATRLNCASDITRFDSQSLR